VLVDHSGPSVTPKNDLADLQIVEFPGLVGKPFFRESAGGQQQMRMVIPLVAFPIGLMYGNVHGAAMAVHDFCREVPGQHLSLARIQLGGQSDLELACDRRVSAPLSQLGFVPQPIPIARPGRALLRHDNLGVRDAGLAFVVVHETRPFIEDTDGGAVRSCGSGATPFRAADRFDAQVIDGYGRTSRHDWHGMRFGGAACHLRDANGGWRDGRTRACVQLSLDMRIVAPATHT
jgi:hypothetical protein